MMEGGCVQGEERRRGPMFGECPMHPGNPMLDCSQCRLDKLQVEKPYEHVNHPKHYNEHPSGVEAIDIIEHMPFNIGTAMKYLWRAGLKPNQPMEQDLDKALWYINREKERLTKARQK